MKIPKFTLLGDDPSGCAGGHCPSVYLGDDGVIYVKGNIVAPTIRAALSPDSNESIVSIPLDILKAAKLCV